MQRFTSYLFCEGMCHFGLMLGFVWKEAVAKLYGNF